MKLGPVKPIENMSLSKPAFHWGIAFLSSHRNNLAVTVLLPHDSLYSSPQRSMLSDQEEMVLATQDGGILPTVCLKRNSGGHSRWKCFADIVLYEISFSMPAIFF